MKPYVGFDFETPSFLYLGTYSPATTDLGQHNSMHFKSPSSLLLSHGILDLQVPPVHMALLPLSKG